MRRYERDADAAGWHDGLLWASWPQISTSASTTHFQTWDGSKSAGRSAARSVMTASMIDS